VHPKVALCTITRWCSFEVNDFLKEELTLTWSKDGHVSTNSCISITKLKQNADEFEDAALKTQDCEKKLPFICEVNIENLDSLICA
jgi:hypothetical protein